MFQKGFKWGTLTTSFVWDSIQSVCRPDKSVTPEGARQSAVQKNRPSHGGHCPVKSFDHAVLVVMIQKSFLCHNSFSIHARRQFVIHELPTVVTAEYFQLLLGESLNFVNDGNNVTCGLTLVS
jgi:hypothetical protein